MLVSTFDTFDMMIVPGNYSELMGSMFLLLPLLYMNTYWVVAPSRVWPHLIEVMSGLIHRTSGRVIAGFTGSMLVFWNFILPLNEYGLLPFSFPVTSHMSMTLAVSMGLWGSLMFLGSFSSYRLTLSHLLPSNVGVLGPFMILVELISSLVRPLTLAFRLAANMTAGHVILSLAAGLSSMMIASGSWWSITIPIAYSAFEVLICWVQAYVFLLLIIFYTNDYVNC